MKMSAWVLHLTLVVICIAPVVADGDTDVMTCTDPQTRRLYGIMMSELKKMGDDISAVKENCFQAATTDTFPTCGCPVSRGMFATFNNHTYLLGLDKMTWHDARLTCLQCGYAMVRVESWAEQEFIKAWFIEAGVLSISTSGPYKLVWMDGTDEGHEGCWVWTHPEITPVASTYQSWASGEPNEGTGAQCMTLWGDRAWSWADLVCSTECLYLCKRPGGRHVRELPLLEDAANSSACQN